MAFFFRLVRENVFIRSFTDKKKHVSLKSWNKAREQHAQLVELNERWRKKIGRTFIVYSY